MNRKRLVVAACVSFLAAACGGDSGTEQVPQTPASLRAAQAPPASAEVATAVDLAVTVQDASGKPVANADVAWRVVEGGGTVAASSRTGKDGIARTSWTLGTRAGAQKAAASIPGVSGVSFSVTGTAAAVAAVTVTAPSPNLSIGGTATLTAARKDAYGNEVTREGVTWSSSDDAIATVSQAGVVTGVARGVATITAAQEGKQGAAGLSIVVQPRIAQITPALLEPGVTAEITGTDFGESAAANQVKVGGVTAAVLQASPTMIRFRVPEASLLPCDLTGAKDVAVIANGVTGTKQHPLRSARVRSLAVGEMLTSLTASELACSEFAAGTGRYIVSVVNAAGDPSASAPFNMRFLNPGSISSSITSASVTQASTAPTDLRMDEHAAGARKHLEVLEANRQLVQRLGIPRRDAGAAMLQMRAPAPSVGDTLSFAIPSLQSLCSSSQAKPVKGRVIYSGTRAVVMEDIAAPLAGTMDAQYRAIGDEFDNSMYPILTQNFGDPLAFDSRTDNNGRIMMLFSPVINGYGNGLLGFVSSGDLYPKSGPNSCAASNTAEIFYAIIPEVVSNAAGENKKTVGSWFKQVRAITIHEVKHIVSNAERFSRNGSANEEGWLEEATAQLSIELWARQKYGYAGKSNVDYRSSVYCEYRQTTAGCTDKPYAVGLGFEWLISYYRATETLSPILGKTASDFGTVYGSGWLFMRWLLDHYAGDPAAVTRAITQEPHLAGVANLEQKAGIRFSDVIGEFMLAVALDDLPSFTPQNAKLTIPSWNTRDIMKGYYTDFGTTLPEFIPSPFPLSVRQVAAGSEQKIDVSRLVGGGGATFELGGNGSAAQLVQLGAPGGTLPPGLRISIVRVQ